MSTYKLLALDMDGTLLNDQQEISAENQKWIQRALNEGMIVMFATGRGMKSIAPYIEQLQLNSPIVAVNGSDVWERPGSLLQRHTLDLQTIKQLHQLSVKYDCWFWGYALEGVFNVNNWTDENASDTWLKFGYYTEDSKILEAIKHEVASWGTLEITNSHPNNLELNPLGVNKAAGLKLVCSHIGINMSEVVTMGDSVNDLAMIQAAGLGVAMGNAQELVKQSANLIAPTNIENGVAHVIEHYLLK